MMKKIIDKLYETQEITYDEVVVLLQNRNENIAQYLFDRSREVSKKIFGNRIYVRGLIEFTNYCKNDCYYCGIRNSNQKAERYRLTAEQILECCQMGHELGFRTFVLQGGEDGYFTDERMTGIIRKIRSKYPDCAITLSLGEKSRETYEKYFAAGANRYLLRHESSNPMHYAKLHPHNLTIEKRKECLTNLKDIGFQVGTGFMIGSPYQTVENLAEDIMFVKEFSPHMVGNGPFVPHSDTPYKDEEAGSVELTLFITGILRLMLPYALLPATTSLGTLDNNGREKGVLAGANVLMPNLSPVNVRKKYALYDNKICTDEEAAECRFCLAERMKRIGYEIVVDRGDFKV